MRDFVLRLVEGARGDALARAESAWGRLPDEKLDELYGESGKTRRQILDAYKAWDARITEAAAWVRSQGGSDGSAT